MASIFVVVNKYPKREEGEGRGGEAIEADSAEDAAHKIVNCPDGIVWARKPRGFRKTVAKEVRAADHDGNEFDCLVYGPF